MITATAEGNNYWVPDKIDIGIIDTQPPDEWNAGLLTASLVENPKSDLNRLHKIDGNERVHWLNQQDGGKRRQEDVGLHAQFSDPRHPCKPIGKSSGLHEARIAPEIEAQARAIGPRGLVADFHGNEEDHNWAMYGPRATSLVRAVASLVSRNVMIVTEGTLPYAVSHAAGFDISNRYRDTYVPEMRALLGAISKGFRPRPRPVTEYLLVSCVTLEAADAYRLRDIYEPFKPIGGDPRAAVYLRDHNLPANSMPMVWNRQRYGDRTGYVAELMVPRQSVAPGAHCATAEVCWKRSVTGLTQSGTNRSVACDAV